MTLKEFARNLLLVQNTYRERQNYITEVCAPFLERSGEITLKDKEKQAELWKHTCHITRLMNSYVEGMLDFLDEAMEEGDDDTNTKAFEALIAFVEDEAIIDEYKKTSSRPNLDQDTKRRLERQSSEAVLVGEMILDPENDLEMVRAMSPVSLRDRKLAIFRAYNQEAYLAEMAVVAH